MVKTTELFWDCECEENYIKPKTEFACLDCGAKAEDQPDSIKSEVIEHLTVMLVEDEIRKVKQYEGLELYVERQMRKRLKAGSAFDPSLDTLILLYELRFDKVLVDKDYFHYK